MWKFNKNIVILYKNYYEVKNNDWKFILVLNKYLLFIIIILFVDNICIYENEFNGFI